MKISKEQQKRYLNSRSDDVAAVATALQEKNSDALIRIGHKIKGSGLTFGFEDIGNIGRSLEDAARENDWAKISQLLTQFRDSITAHLSDLNP